MKRAVYVAVIVVASVAAQSEKKFQTIGPDGRIVRAGEGKSGAVAPKTAPVAPKAAAPAQKAPDQKAKPAAPVVAAKPGADPVPIYRRDPGYTFLALAAEFEGSERVRFGVNQNGETYNIQSDHALPFGLDDRSISIVRAWRYRPGSPKPRISADMVFRLSNRVVPSDANDPSALHAAAVRLLNSGASGARRAYELYSTAANKGYLPSQVSLCWLYLEGWETARDFIAGRRWCEKAAAQNSAAAQYMMGDIVAQGKGVKMDAAAAIAWYTKAAQHGYPPAELALGKAYAFGTGVKPDAKAGAMWLEKAARHGMPEAQFMYADHLQSGRGVKPDRSQALFWAAIAARQGYANAMTSFSRMRTQAPPPQVAEAEKSAEAWRPAAQ